MGCPGSECWWGPRGEDWHREDVVLTESLKINRLTVMKPLVAITMAGSLIIGRPTMHCPNGCSGLWSTTA